MISGWAIYVVALLFACCGVNAQDTEILDWTDSPAALKAMVARTTNKTDKTSTHMYHEAYHALLSPLAIRARHGAHTRIRMLEIGLGCNMPKGPGGSVLMFQAMFLPPIAFEHHVMEFDETCAKAWDREFNGDGRVVLHIGDQNSTRDLDSIVESLGRQNRFNIVIDDGSHHSEHQRNSLLHLCSHMAPGGVYFVEDIPSSCKSYVANEPGVIIDQRGRKVGGREVGGTAGCMVLKNGEPTFFADLVLWSSRMAKEIRVTVPGRPHCELTQIATFHQVAVLVFS